MKLTTVICNYNTRDVLARALDSLVATSGDLAHEIIVVDNASHDGSAAMVRERFPAVTLIEPGRNTWYSGGNNLGMRAAQGDYVLILNPDTVIQPGTLQTLIAYLDARPAVGAVTARMTFADGTVQRICSRFADYPDFMLSYTVMGTLRRQRRERLHRAMWYDGWDRDTTRAVEVAPGSCLMLRRDLIARGVLFDERLKLFFTDDDLCRQVLRAGASVHYVAEATIIHDEHASLDQVPALTRRVYFEDMLAYVRKYHGAWGARWLALWLAPTRAAMQAKHSLRTFTHKPGR